jgi:hypothetical protein
MLTVKTIIHAAIIFSIFPLITLVVVSLAFPGDDQRPIRYAIAAFMGLILLTSVILSS